MRWLPVLMGGVFAVSACKPTHETLTTLTSAHYLAFSTDTLQLRAEQRFDEEEVVECTIEYDTIAGRVVPTRVVTLRSKQAKQTIQSVTNRHTEVQQRDSTWQYVVINRQPGIAQRGNYLLQIGYGVAALLLFILLLINKLRK